MATLSDDTTQQNQVDAIDRLAELAAGRPSPDVYFAEFLAVLQQVAPYQLAAVWGLNQQGIVERIVERRAEGSDPLPAARVDPRRRIHQVIELLAAGQPRVMESAPATYLAPLSIGDKPVGAVELLVDELTGDARAALAPFMAQASAYITRLSAPTPIPQRGDSQAEANATGRDALRIALELHRESTVEGVAGVAVNELRPVLRADRVSLAVAPEGRLAAVSGREHVAPRSEGMKSLRKVAELVLASGQAGQLDGGPMADARGGESPLSQALAEHAARSGARNITALPLTPPGDADSDAHPATPDTPPVAVLLVEQFTAEKSLDTSSLRGNADQTTLGGHLAVAIAAAQSRERHLSSWPGRVLNRFYGPRERPQAWRALTWFAIAIVGLTLVGFVPATYRVETRGTLSPAVRSMLFAPDNSDVAELLVQGGQQVGEGDVLIRLVSDRLDSEMLAIETRLRERRQARRSLQAELDQRTAAPDDNAEIRLRGRLSQAEIEIEGLAARLAEIEREQEQLTIRAPHAGRIATFEPDRLLDRRPVARGEVLLEVMQFDGAWRLELDCPSSEMGHVVAEQQNKPTTPLAVEFILATEPRRTLRATVTRVATRATRAEGQLSTVRLEAVVDPESLPSAGAPLAGSEVVARVDCGKQPLAYVLFGSAYDWTRRTFW